MFVYVASFSTNALPASAMSAASSSGVCSTPWTMSVEILPALLAATIQSDLADRAIGTGIEHVENLHPSVIHRRLDLRDVGGPAGIRDREAEVPGAAHVRRVDGWNPELRVFRLRLLAMPPRKRDAGGVSGNLTEDEQLLEGSMSGRKERDS